MKPGVKGGVLVRTKKDEFADYSYNDDSMGFAGKMTGV